MGRVVVATDIRGCREVVVDDETGVLVPPQDEHRLAEAILRLLDDREAARRMGEAGRERAQKHFDEEAVIERTLAVYHALLDGRKLRGSKGEPPWEDRVDREAERRIGVKGGL